MENKGEIIIYKGEGEQIQIDVRLEEETVWLTQRQMVELFNSSKANVSEHIKAVFTEGELEPNSTVRNFRTVQNEGNRIITRNMDYYNLDVIISVGYRVKSKRGTQFRIWANKVLKEYLLQGYSLNERLLNRQNEIVELAGKGCSVEEIANRLLIPKGEIKLILDLNAATQGDRLKTEGEKYA